MFPPHRVVSIQGKLELGFDRLETYRDIVERSPTPRMLEAAFAAIADSINYTVEGVLFVKGRAASEYAGAPVALSAVYATVVEAGRALPPEARLRAIITRVPGEADLRSVIQRRNTSVHEYPRIRYVAQPEVDLAYHDALSFWAASAAVLLRVPGLAEVGHLLEGLVDSRDIESAGSTTPD